MSITHKWEGNFDINKFRNGMQAELGKTRSLLNGEKYHHGIEEKHEKYTFSDGAIYIGEIYDE